MSRCEHCAGSQSLLFVCLGVSAAAAGQSQLTTAPSDSWSPFSPSLAAAGLGSVSASCSWDTFRFRGGRLSWEARTSAAAARWLNSGLLTSESWRHCDYLFKTDEVLRRRSQPTCQGMLPRCPARGRRCRCGGLRGGGGRPGTARGCRCARRPSSRGCARRPSPRSRGPACRSRCSLSRSLLAASFGSLRARWSDLWSPGWASAGNCGRTSWALLSG